MFYRTGLPPPPNMFRKHLSVNVMNCVLFRCFFLNSHHYFKYCKISALALLKMVMHARSGGNLEVMGLMLGKVDGETMMIMDSFALPVEGTETRVNAQAAAYEYMAAYIENAKQVEQLSSSHHHTTPDYT